MENQTKELKVKYDEDHDTLNVLLGDLNDGFMVEIEPNFTLKLSIESGEVIGYTIKDYSNNVHKNKIWSKKLTTNMEKEYDGAFFGKMLSRDKKTA
ncbi:MAG: hypothetical protein QMC67_11200 [Candidatus Wallbacteria bacterium]